TDTVKEALMNGGAVAVSYYHSEVFLKYIWDQEEITEAVYNSAQHHKGSTNHAVTLVGWDDNFDRNKFDTKPSANGAWLIKNSWGENWGKDGYFWISYEDMSLMSSLACQYTVVKADENENIYQYDGTISPSTYLNSNSHTISAANVYTATRNEVLHSAGFFTDADNVDYTVSACLLNGNPSDPEDATLCLETSGTAEVPGYHEVELSSPMNIEKGQAFSIIVTLTPDVNSDDHAYMYVNESGDYGWISFTNKVTAGTSYIYNFLGEGTWDDISNMCRAEARIKAYTYAAPDYDYAHIDVDPKLNVGDIRTLHPSFLPDFGNPDSIYWKSSDENVVKVENGTIYACAPGTACIGVCSKKTDEWIGYCFVEVVQPIMSVESSADYIVVPTGGSVELSAWVMPEDHTEGAGDIYWESVDEYVVTVDRLTTGGANDMQTVNYVANGKVTIYAKSVARSGIYKAITVFSGT
ncbi:MAG: hypothetical protein HUJ58_04995, partial [Erysipelotrichaceae bacterium]|nr:hypothetical protein [Erysipelotrichaceae bacterium]